MKNKNELFPVFLKTHLLKTLIIGGGDVAHEKLHFLLKSSPDSRVTVIAPKIKNEIKDFLSNHYFLELKHREFQEKDISGYDIIIAATGDRKVNQEIYQSAKQFGKLINVADTPDLCDFYLGGVVTKGNLKIAISTNGKSPTMAKRLRELFEEIIPDELDESLESLYEIRSKMKLNFKEKVQQLNDITKNFKIINN